MSVPFVFSNNVLIVQLDKPVNIAVDDKRFASVVEMIKEKKTAEEIQSFLDNFNELDFTLKDLDERFRVDGDKVYYGDIKLPKCLVEKIRHITEYGLPMDSLIEFIKNIDENPSNSSKEELYDFLEHKYLPITDDGYFFAYKSIRPNFKDWYTNSVDNSPGCKPKMKRNEVNDNRNEGCSEGYHVGALNYASTFQGGAVVVLVKVHPKDVVSVPLDCSCQKVRVCEYEVVKVMENQLESPVVDSRGNEYPPNRVTSADVDWDDIEDDPSNYEEEYDEDFDDEDDWDMYDEEYDNS